MADNELDFIHVMQKLQDRAEEDGEVTEDEEKFLSTLSDEVEEYETALEEAKLDEFISEDEFHDLVILRDRILNRAMDFTTASQDVNALVQELFDEINRHEIPGMADDEKTDEQETTEAEQI